MAPRLPAVHCELGPVLVNRTAVYRLCRALPAELERRGFRVSCSALLARLDTTAAPQGPWNRHWYELSSRWLHWAVAHPGWFLRTRWLSPLRYHRGIPLFFDPLYLLFHARIDASVVLVYDVTPVTDPAWHGPGISRLYSAAFDHLARSCCQVVAVSRNTADHLRVNWGVAPSRLTVLPLGPFGQVETTAEPSVPDAEPFLLFVGSLEPRKNVAGLLRAYRASRLFTERGIRLRVIGAVPEQAGELAALARAIPGVDLLGSVGDAELAAAYRDCLAFVYPSFCEGFGLPLLEAMSHGRACLATRTGASPEVGGKSCLYVNPYSIREIARGLQRLAAMPETERQQREALARRRAQRFTWPSFYDGLAKVLTKVWH